MMIGEAGKGFAIFFVVTMEIQKVKDIYATLPQCGAFMKALADPSVHSVFLDGLLASSASLFFASLAGRQRLTAVFVLQGADEAGYFYHDLTQALGTGNVLFFPSSYRRAVKYGQRDAANEILRTEVLSRLSSQAGGTPGEWLYVVTCPEAMSELVVSKKQLDERTLQLSVGQTVNLVETERTLRSFGFAEVDYVYEPGQFAVRGSILDVYSFSSELPFRIDFFGDEIDTIRTFEVQDQLSKARRDTVQIVPELSGTTEEKMPFTSFLPADTMLVVKDLLFACSAVEQIYADGFSSQAMAERLEGATEMEQRQIMESMKKENLLVSPSLFRDALKPFRIVEFGHSASLQPQATIRFSVTPQPLFHKNFNLLADSLEDYILKGYRLYILADSEKQTQRLRDIFDSDELRSARAQTNAQKAVGENASVADGLPFTPVDHTPVSYTHLTLPTKA